MPDDRLPPQVAAAAQGLRDAVEGGRLDLPLPGHGRTLERWRALVDLAADGLSLARLAEAHVDALAILHELDGGAAPAGSRWGVWAARPPEAPLTARQDGDRWRLDGTKPWCSGARACTHALVTADAEDGYRLFAVELAGARPLPDTWPAVGMAGSDSLSVDLTGLDAVPVGGPGAYLERPGFWHGGMAVAACWHGGAVGVGRALLASCRSDPHALAHLGAVDAALSGGAAALQAAAAAVDADPQDRAAAVHRLAARLRAQTERSATEVLDRVGRALGAGPLCRDARHAMLAADLPVYLRQSHAEADLAGLGELARERDPAW